jgi:hypothetical protein
VKATLARKNPRRHGGSRSQCERETKKKPDTASVVRERVLAKNCSAACFDVTAVRTVS